MPIKEQEKDAINGLSEKEKEELINQLTSAVTESAPKNSIEDVEIEMG